MKKVLFAIFAGLLSIVSAGAQTISGTTALSVSTVSNSAALAGVDSGKFAVIWPSPGSTAPDIFFALGSSSVSASTSSPPLLPGGVCVNVGNATYVAAISASGSATLRINMMTQCPQGMGFTNGGGSGGIAGNVAVTNFPATTGPVAPGSAAANSQLNGAIYTASPSALTTGQQAALQMDALGNLKEVRPASVVSSSIPAGTINGTNFSISVPGAYAGAYLVQLDIPANVTGGAITFQTSGDNGANWSTAASYTVTDPTSSSLPALSIPYTLVSNTNKQFLILAQGQQVRLQVSTTYTNSASNAITLVSNPIFQPQNVMMTGVGSAPILTSVSQGASNTTNISQIFAVAPATPAATVIKSSAGRLYSLNAGNSGASDVWVDVFNVAAASVVLGTTNPTLSLYVPKGTTQSFSIADLGDYYSNAGFSYAVVGGIGASNASITATTVSVNIRYQ